MATAILGRYLTLGEAVGCSGLVSPFSFSPISRQVLESKIPLFFGILATPMVLPYLGLAHLLPSGGFQAIESTSRLILAMLCVGFGSKFGGGCTSGHGLSGIGRLSIRSMTFVLTFMVVGALVAIQFDTPSMLHVASTMPEKGKVAGVAVNAISNAVAATQADKALYAKIISTAFFSYAAIAFAAKSNVIKRGSKVASYVKSLVHGATGVLFGVGLCVGQMVNPAKVATFLTFTKSTFDPSLMVLMGAALAALVPGFYLIKKQFTTSGFGDSFAQPDTVTAEIDLKLVVGGAIFGAGWGLAGTCPGPLYVNVGAALSNGSFSFLSGTGLALLTFWVGQSLARLTNDLLAGGA